jgi:hypothetical protein
MKRLLVFSAAALLAFGLFAQDIKLPGPAAKANLDLLSAIQNRKVSKAFVKKAVPMADLSTILWSGLGLRGVDAVTSATKAGRTVSFSGDNAYINMYVLTDKGSWKYLPDSHALKSINQTDSRATVSKASVPEAAFMVVYTVDNALTPNFLKANPAVFQQMANATAGFAAQNMSLTATAYKLSTIIQYTLSPAAAATALSLGKDESPLFILQAGYTE